MSTTEQEPDWHAQWTIQMGANADLRARIEELEKVVIALRDELVDACPAWALEWDRVSDVECFTAQEVRDAARDLLDPICRIVFAALEAL